MTTLMRSIFRSSLATVLIVSVSLLAAKGPGGGGGNKPPGGEEGGNNLSYPAMYSLGVPDNFVWQVPGDLLGVFGEHYSYGCDTPETVDIFSYPNTSCVLDDETTFLDAAECTVPSVDILEPPCEGLPVDRIYWQKVVDNQWNAETIVAGVENPTTSHLDWGDNLESNTWSAGSVIRVEAQPYHTTTGGGNPCLGAYPDCLKGFQMWHVSGHGPTERWGVRTDLDTRNPNTYVSPYAIIHTSHARLNLTKLQPGVAECPTPGSGEGDDPPALGLVWLEDLDNPGEMMWSGLDTPCKLRDTDFTAELNVGGKWVYGYNWSTKRDELTCGEDWEMPGWWRLTFYTENGEVVFNSESVIGPPDLPGSAPSFIGLSAESETEESMYSPVIDAVNNLTYIDICLTSAKGGGGGGGGGKGPTDSGPPW